MPAGEAWAGQSGVLFADAAPLSGEPEAEGPEEDGAKKAEDLEEEEEEEGEEDEEEETDVAETWEEVEAASSRGLSTIGS